MKVPFMDLKTQYYSIAQEVNEQIKKVMERGDFILGKEMELFEKEFAQFCGVKHAIGVSSGTDAIHIALLSLDIGKGDEVITAANTFIATILAISYTGAKPVLVDAEPETYNMDVSKIESVINEKTKAIIPVHLYGQPADMEPILEIANKHNLSVIEDCAQAHGALYKGRPVGSFGTIGCFSFYPAKNLGAYGDAGMIVTDDTKIMEKSEMFRNYGQKAKYHHEVKGFNNRLDTIQAAILSVKLKKLTQWNNLRRRHAQLYNKLFETSAVVTPKEFSYAKHVYHLYVVRVEQRDKLKDFLSRQGISTGIHYPIPIHLQPSYRELGYKEGSFPVTENYASSILSLPMFPELRDEQIKYVVENILIKYRQ